MIMECRCKLPRIDRILPCDTVIYSKKLVFHPTNSKKGIPVVGNLRVSIR